MKLSDTKVRNAKPKETPYKLFDGGGLYLLVKPNGKKYWRFKYQFLNKERGMAFGVYPDISLLDARERRDEARKLKAKGFDPAESKRQEKEKILGQSQNRFELIALEWHALKSSSWSPYYAKQVMQRLEADVLPRFGSKPMEAIKVRDILAMAQAIQKRNAIEMAHRAVNICAKVFQYAVVTERAEYNPALNLSSALQTPQTNNYAHLNAKELPEFLASLAAYDGGYQTKLAIKLLMLTFVRTSELCGAKWSEIDLERAEWIIPAERMKMRSVHVVPLSKEAIAIFETLRRLNRKSEFVFPSTVSARRTMSNNTMLVAIHTMGYKGRTTGHGFRATASTILNESGQFGHDVIERQLAHQQRDKVRAAYNHADYMQKRREMMQWWADYLAKAGNISAVHTKPTAKMHSAEIRQKVS